MRFLAKENIESGISVKFDRKHRFVIKRIKSNAGIVTFILRNLANNDKISIPQYLLDRFRTLLSEMAYQLSENTVPTATLDKRLQFKSGEFYRFHHSTDTLGHVVIQSLTQAGRMSIPRDALNELVELLYDTKMDHPNGTFDRIIDYHKLFQFTFSRGSTSLSSNLILRRDILNDIGDYIPRPPRARESIISISKDEQALESEIKGFIADSSTVDKKKESGFKKKLGERYSDQDYSVNYESLFSKNKTPTTTDSVQVSESLSIHSTKTSCPVPLLASDIKAHAASVYKCELSAEDASALRESFLSNRDTENLLGFEIFTAIYKSNGGKLRQFRFPLYYMNVKIEESGRTLYITPPKHGDVYLNHLSLAVFIEKFSKSKRHDPLSSFFNTLLSQKIEVDKTLQKITIHRQLPYSEDVYRQTRDILIGKQGENGRGGIIERLDIVGIECDLDSVILYKADRHPSPLARMLDQDLASIQETAHDYPDRFYASLLGQFLNPERRFSHNKEGEFCLTPYMPGRANRSSRALIDNLNAHNLLLLEGPPGTGKTFTIRNLFLHCLNSGKRLLIVSDQQAAIHALTEKLKHYLLDAFQGDSHTVLDSKSRLNLWDSAIKIIDDLPGPHGDLAEWTNKLGKMLKMELAKEQDWPSIDDNIEEKIKRIDQEQANTLTLIKTLFEDYFTHKDPGEMLCSKTNHPNNDQEINDLITFIRFIGAEDYARVKRSTAIESQQALTSGFIRLRRDLRTSDLNACYSTFNVYSDEQSDLHILNAEHIDILRQLVERKPKIREDFLSIFPQNSKSTFCNFLKNDWESHFDEYAQQSLPKRISTSVAHPCLKHWRYLLGALQLQEKFFSIVREQDNAESLLRQFQAIHETYAPGKANPQPCIALEMFRCVFSRNHDKNVDKNYVFALLDTLQSLQKQRDHLVSLMTLQSLAKIAKKPIANRKNNTNRATTIINALDALKSCGSIDSANATPILHTLQETLWESFPIWICRKQAVSFLLPSCENMFDLVIVDEAGQCRVDDALPLLYRAKKLMVVGDDKQTVMDKNSVIDDYLFKEFELEEHLRTTQARGVKGGGSNLFELVKSIKQGGVMLDEHYRCPPAIIAYSNRYVYNAELRIMQWQLPDTPPSVIVDYSEKLTPDEEKAQRGKYKGIETAMIDRFFNYIITTIKRIEIETNTRINVERDVAICYFLLKNEPYIEDQKSVFLKKLNRGSDILHGAGAALQGKERKYIFYLWDITSSNIAFFRQGDDADKRKGELNVLMSRPQSRAYHYLHKNFDMLKHDSATITDYLWKIYQAQNENRYMANTNLTTTLFDNKHSATGSTSGQSFYAVLSLLLPREGLHINEHFDIYFNLMIGDPKYRVDLLLSAKNSGGNNAIAVIDLSVFENQTCAQERIADYYFQLQRATPSVSPIFCFLHELSDERTPSYQHIKALVKAHIASGY